MGGNALKRLKTDRLSTSDYNDLQGKIDPLINSMVLASNNHMFTNSYYYVKSYFEKETHGDLDILIFTSDCNFDFKDYIINNFKPNQIVKNGNVISFDFNNFQIDLIFYESKYKETAKIFHDYNDVGNLLGKLAARLSLKLGPTGLKIQMKSFQNDSYKYMTFILPFNVKQIFLILNVDYHRYVKGFSNIPEIFDFIASSIYFNYDSFVLDPSEDTTSKQRHRDKHRKTYCTIASYLKENVQFQNKRSVRLNYAEAISNVHYFLRLMGDFDTISQILNIQMNIENNIIISNKVNTKFNGNIVSQYYNIHGKELGQKMKDFNNCFEDVNQKNRFILSNSITDILKFMDEQLGTN